MVIREGGTPQSKLGRENQRLRARIEELEEALEQIVMEAESRRGELSNAGRIARRALSPIDGEEGHPDSCACPECDVGLHGTNAAPDTEGREGPTSADISFGEAKTVHGGACSCPLCVPDKPMSRARPEEAGGEDELRNTYTDAGLAEACDVAAIVVHHHPDKNYARVLAHQLEKARDRLRGAPEGAGDTTPVKLHHSDVAAYILEGPDGPVSRDEALRSLHKLRELALPARLRTGREGRDDG